MTQCSLRRLRTALLLALGYAACFAVLTYPLVLDLRHTFVASPQSGASDAFIFPWNIHTFRESLRAGTPLFHTDRVLYPIGASLVFHTYTPLAGLVGLLFGNCVLALNVVVFLEFVLSGMGAYLLCRRYCGSRWLSAMAGIAFSFCPLKINCLMGHYNTTMTATIPWFAWSLVTAFPPGESGKAPVLRSRGRAFLAVTLLLLTLLADFYYTLYMALFAAAYFAYFPIHRRGLIARALRHPVWTLALFVGVPTIGVFIIRRVMDVGHYGALTLGTDLLSLVLPTPNNRLLGPLLAPGGSAVGGHVGYLVLLPALGYLALREYRKAGPELRALLFALCALVVFSMPVVRFAHKPLFALPPALLHFIPPLDLVRSPGKAFFLAMLLIPIPAALLIERRVLPRLAPRLRGVVAGALCVGLLLEYLLIPLPVYSTRGIPEVHHRLAALPEGTLLELPFGVASGFTQYGRDETRQMLFQTVHHKPLVAGLISRLPQETLTWFREQPLIGDLLVMQDNPDARPREHSRDAVDAAIRTFRLKYVIVYPEQRGTPLETYLLQHLGDWVESDEDVQGYRLLQIRQIEEVRGAGQRLATTASLP